ncbi:hypothetical protein AOLI_G00197540 [Acnodon oligacanthus]
MELLLGIFAGNICWIICPSELKGEPGASAETKPRQVSSASETRSEPPELIWTPGGTKLAEVTRPGTANTKQDALSIQWEPLGPDPFPEPTLFPLLGSWLHTVGSLRLIMEALRQEPDSGGRRPGLPPAKDNMVILVLVDCFSKACKFMPLPKLSSAKETVELLFSTWSGFTGR